MIGIDNLKFNVIKEKINIKKSLKTLSDKENNK